MYFDTMDPALLSELVGSRLESIDSEETTCET